MTSPAPFSPVALAYAQHIAELDAAKAVFEGERSRLMERLVNALGPSTSIQPKLEGKKWEYASYYLETARWTEVRRKRGKRGCRAGFTFAIDRLSPLDGGDHLSFAAYVFFEMGRPAFNQLPTEITEALELPFTRADRFARGWHRVFPVESPGFVFDSMENAIRELPEVFASVDQRITAAYEAAVPIGAPGIGGTAQDEEDG